ARLEAVELLVAPDVAAAQEDEVVLAVADEPGGVGEARHGGRGREAVVAVVAVVADVDDDAVGRQLEGGEAVLVGPRQRGLGLVGGAVAAEVAVPVGDAVAVVVDPVVALGRTDGAGAGAVGLVAGGRRGAGAGGPGRAGAVGRGRGPGRGPGP